MSAPSAKSSKALRRLPVLLLCLAALVLLIYVLWRIDTAPSTDDAYVQADTIDVVPDVNGRIVELAVRENQAVKRGDLLFRIEPRPFQDELDRAQASLTALDKQIELLQRTVKAQRYNAESVQAVVERARATVAQTQLTLKRTEPLLAPGYVSAEDVDRARTAQRAAQADLAAAQLQAQQAAAAVTGVDALEAQRAALQAEIALARWRLEMTEVRAPFDGRVAALKVAVGQYASMLKPVFTLIDTEHWYVIANFRETELKHIRAGTAATLFLMSDSSRRFDGQVESIGYGVLPDDGGLVLEGLPRVQRSLNWVRVAQRFPVRIRVEQPDAELFRIGASAVAVLAPEKPAGSQTDGN